MYGMNDPDPAQAASLEELAECLRQIYVRADRPSLRQLEERTKFANGLLPGTHLERVRLGRTSLNDVLRGLKFPRKAFLLTFVEALNVDLEVDRRWEQAWDRLAVDRGLSNNGTASGDSELKTAGVTATGPSGSRKSPSFALPVPVR